jgi:hypothetical protein
MHYYRNTLKFVPWKSSLKWPDHGRENENYNPHHDRQRDPDLYEIGELVSTWAIDHKVGLIAHG